MKPLLFKDGIKEYSLDGIVSLEYSKKIIYKISKKYINFFDIDDLIQNGYIGLIKAYNKYDINVGILFITYAHNVIQQELLNYVRDENRKVQYSLDLNNLIEGENNDTEVINTLPNENYNVESEGILNTVIDTFVKTLRKEKHKQITELFLEGQMQSDIYKQLNCSKDMVEGVVKKLRKYVRQELEVTI